jgi:DeoR family transcriptional regulator, suf operon transcriptional repressor
MSNNANLLTDKTGAKPDPAVSSRHQILLYLLENKNGVPIDGLIKHLNISRTAVQNHFLILEKQGFIKKNNRQKTMGRPSAHYILTEKGTAYFPKHYSLFSNVLLVELSNEMGSDQFAAFMQKLGSTLANQYQTRFEGLSEIKKIDTLFELMQELGFHPQLLKNTRSSTIEINVYNCIYHDIAQQFHEVCKLDIRMVETLLDKPVGLSSCMAKGDGVCCLRMSLGKDQ